MRITAAQQTEIQSLRNATHNTLRPTVPALEEVLFNVIPVLDHGFVRVVDYMGDDASIVQAARVSYGRGTRKAHEDRGLIRYLLRHNHTTPFEMCEIKLHCKLPIFVARQWIRHRTANVNEYSARYSIMDREFYIPDPNQMGVQSSANRQGRGKSLSNKRARAILRMLRQDASRCYDHYEEMLNVDRSGQPIDEKEPGLARELARINLTLSYYTQWYWKIDLHNLFNFLGLRLDSHAQEEIRAYAKAIGDLTRRWVPNAWEAFRDYRVDAVRFSRAEREVLNAMLTGKTPDMNSSGLSKREQEEFLRKVGELPGKLHI